MTPLASIWFGGELKTIPAILAGAPVADDPHFVSVAVGP